MEHGAVVPPQCCTHRSLVPMSQSTVSATWGGPPAGLCCSALSAPKGKGGVEWGLPIPAGLWGGPPSPVNGRVAQRVWVLWGQVGTGLPGHVDAEQRRRALQDSTVRGHKDPQVPQGERPHPGMLVPAGPEHYPTLQYPHVTSVLLLYPWWGHPEGQGRGCSV